MERKIGERFEYDGLKLEVVENDDNHCEGCYFQKWIICRFPVVADITGMCSATQREDKKDVIFKDVTEQYLKFVKEFNRRLEIVERNGKTNR